ncbi:uncharacterized protein [Halyomorpha halys]|uniref:uncharacterized protein n=1 Tax=Halyomorpha halys TaxID=286706 RepID=UPI0006D4FB62|nr:uncharacterized protein LOC106685315 [Halyomorpha halys]
MRLPKILYLQLAIIIILSPEEINSQRIRTRNGGKNRQLQINVDEKSLKLKKQPVSEKSSVSDEDDERKTLAQQVLDGKYGLIQTELFASPVKRPGILSYEINPEVPKDNINNLGGLKPEEIWLAENHLLVLKGGSFSDNEQGSKMIWPPIDSYVAPQRQVKIPQNPKIPPPFPIQLKEGGPIEVIRGKNGTKNIPAYFGPPFLYQNPVNLPNEANENETKQRQGNLTQGNGGIPFPFLPPEIGLYPPAIAFLPPPGNLTELDEDDPSIYYPPRYDFTYTKNYTSFVPAGPLVPGIILPPPPNFFAPLENDTSERTNPVSKQASSIKKTSKSRTSGINRVRSKLQPHGNSIKPKGLNTTQEQKMISPVQYTSNKHQNKITLPLTSNRTKEDWVPIPAPRPFYITDISKLKIINGEDSNETPLKYDIPKNGWAYDNTTRQELHTEKYQPQRFKSTKVNDNMGLYMTTGISNENFIVSNSPRPTMKNVQLYESNYDDEKQLVPQEYSKITKINNIKIVKPSLNENTTPANHLKQYYFNKNHYKSNTLLPEVIYEDFSVTTPSVNGRVIVPNIKYEDYKNTIKGTSKPLSFLYYEQEPKYQADDGGYRYDVPENSNINPYRQEQFGAIPPNEKKITYSTTQKPPIYEYSYSAPGYGTLEAPKVGINYETTSKPIIYESNLKSKQPQYTYYEFQTTPKQNEFNYHLSNVDSIYPTVQPQVNIKNKYININSFKTEEPYIPYNTQDKGQDENTKDYFISFGQKINQKDRERTSSISQPNQQYYTKTYYENFDYTTPLPPQTSNKNIRFPDTYNTQGDTPYYTKKEYSVSKYENSNKNTKSNVPTDNYSYFYGPSNIGFQNYREYEHGIVQPNHPLHSDIDVNYKRTNPHLNPDAEFIDQTYTKVHPKHPLNSDIDVNYKIPNPTINPDAEFIEQTYIKVRPNHPLNSDINVNYKIQNPTINPEAEYIDQAYINPKHYKDNSYVSYRLPGNSGHFYFLTPQTIQQQTYQERNSRLRYPENKSQFIRRH